MGDASAAVAMVTGVASAAIVAVCCACGVFRGATAVAAGWGLGEGESSGRMGDSATGVVGAGAFPSSGCVCVSCRGGGLAGACRTPKPKGAIVISVGAGR